MIKPENIYKYRSLLSPLYTQDIRFESDLVDSIYSTLSDTKLIESYNFDLNNSNISVTLSEKATNQDFCTVINSIEGVIIDYINKNIHNLDTSKIDMNEFTNSFLAQPRLIYDVYTIGRQINIGL